jgi:hypothetical protein
VGHVVCAMPDSHESAQLPYHVTHHMIPSPDSSGLLPHNMPPPECIRNSNADFCDYGVVGAAESIDRLAALILTILLAEVRSGRVCGRSPVHANISSEFTIMSHSFI